MTCRRVHVYTHVSSQQVSADCSFLTFLLSSSPNTCWGLLLDSAFCILCLCLSLGSILIYSSLCCTSVVRLQR